FRWLTVGPAGQPDISIVLMAIPGPPLMDDATAAQVRDLVAKGFAGTVFLGTDDCRRSYEELSARGVEFIDPPPEMPYGIDAAFRAPSGNNARLTQLAPTWCDPAGGRRHAARPRRRPPAAERQFPSERAARPSRRRRRLLRPWH